MEQPTQLTGKATKRKHKHKGKRHVEVLDESLTVIADTIKPLTQSKKHTQESSDSPASLPSTVKAPGSPNKHDASKKHAGEPSVGLVEKRVQNLLEKDAILAQASEEVNGTNESWGSWIQRKTSRLFGGPGKEGDAANETTGEQRRLWSFLSSKEHQGLREKYANDPAALEADKACTLERQAELESSICKRLENKQDAGKVIAEIRREVEILRTSDSIIDPEVHRELKQEIEHLEKEIVKQTVAFQKKQTSMAEAKAHLEHSLEEKKYLTNQLCLVILDEERERDRQRDAHMKGQS